MNIQRSQFNSFSESFCIKKYKSTEIGREPFNTLNINIFFEISVLLNYPFTLNTHFASSQRLVI